MSRKMSRTLLVSAFLSASLALGAAPSFAQMAPDNAGISAADWEEVIEIGELNGAYTTYVDDTGKATLVFTGSNVPDDLQYPADFTGFENPDLTLWGEYSQFATNQEITAILSAAMEQLSTAGYQAAAQYNEDTDVVDVITQAPASATAPLVATYGSKIAIVPHSLTLQQSATGGKAHGSTKKHAPAKTGKKTAKKTAKKASTKASKKTAAPAPAPAPAPVKLTKVLLTSTDPQ